MDVRVRVRAHLDDAVLDNQGVREGERRVGGALRQRAEARPRRQQLEGRGLEELVGAAQPGAQLEGVVPEEHACHGGGVGGIEERGPVVHDVTDEHEEHKVGLLRWGRGGVGGWGRERGGNGE